MRPFGRAVRSSVLASFVVLTAVACHRASQQVERASVVSIPRDAARFEIDVVDDSTARFRLKEATWIRPGMVAYAVDPANRDVLVARLLLVRSDGEAMTALITSQVARVTTSHFLLVAKPETQWWRATRFWLGAAAGSALGAASVLLTK